MGKKEEKEEGRGECSVSFSSCKDIRSIRGAPFLKISPKPKGLAS